MITLFGGFVFFAILYVSRPEIHKRMMLLATASMLASAIARVLFALSVGIGPGLRPGLGPPRTIESVLMPALIADSLIVAGVIYDMRTRGRPHPAYLIGGAILLAVQVLRVPLERFRVRRMTDFAETGRNLRDTGLISATSNGKPL